MPRPNRGPHLVWLQKRGRFYVREYVQGRARDKSTGTSDRGEAEAVLADVLQRRRRRGGPCPPDAYPVADALAAYGEEKAPRTEAPERIGYAISALMTFWGDNMAVDITENTCVAYAGFRDVSDGTVRRELGVLRAAVNWAHRHGRLTRAPFVELPPNPPHKDRWLTRAEAAALLRAARVEPHARLHLPLFIVLGLYTGARKGAILDLRWNQVDLDRGRIDFNPPGRKRTNKGRPIIPIPRRLMTFLRLARRRGSDLGHVVHQDGRRLKDIKTGFAGAAKRSGLDSLRTKVGETSDGRPLYQATVSPHVLRHTAGTWMAQRGVDLFQVAGWLGQSYQRTVELYAHHHPDFMQQAKAAMEAR